MQKTKLTLVVTLIPQQRRLFHMLMVAVVAAILNLVMELMVDGDKTQLEWA